jgi:hypothetical protein
MHHGRRSRSASGDLVASGTDQDLGDYVAAGGKQIHNGVIRDIIAHDIRRDAVSIEGRPEGSISHLLVENIWLYRNGCTHTRADELLDVRPCLAFQSAPSGPGSSRGPLCQTTFGPMSAGPVVQVTASG